jgi:citrate lyase beta subunit
MVETPAGVLAAAGIAEAVAATGGIGVLVMGTNDLAKELGARHAPDRAPMAASLGLCVLAARAHGIGCLDGVFNAFRDEDGLRAECAQGRAMGFDGKTLIHPAQIAAANEAFAPGAEEVETARREIEAFEAAQAEGRGVAVLDGRLIEALHVETARATLARADAIAEGEAA